LLRKKAGLPASVLGIIEIIFDAYSSCFFQLAYFFSYTFFSEVFFLRKVLIEAVCPQAYEFGLVPSPI